MHAKIVFAMCAKIPTENIDEGWPFGWLDFWLILSQSRMADHAKVNTSWFNLCQGEDWWGPRKANT